MELGIYTFGDLPADASGPRAAQQHLQEIVAAAKLADEAGLHVFGVGEHHRSDCAVSAHTVVLGAIAAVTRRIRLTSAETIISSADPVRVFEDFATLDLLSSGPAELMAGRGAFIESFPLFGFALQDYEALYNEKLELLLKLRHCERITWEGRFRPSLDDAEVSPRPISASLPIWIGAGGTPQSAVRADQAGLGRPEQDNARRRFCSALIDSLIPSPLKEKPCQTHPRRPAPECQPGSSPTVVAPASSWSGARQMPGTGWQIS